MSKPTGIGKIQELSRKGKNGIRRKALLFNFDIDGDQIKDEHKLWLDQNIVPLLNNVGLVINLRGLASRSGSAAHNKALSDRRVGSVKQFLTAKGGNPGQFQMEAVGESDAEIAGQTDGTEDETFRGVVVTVASRGRNTKVEFEQVFFHHKENGFDATTTPRWLMVPIEALSREIRVVNGAGFRIRSRNTGIALVASFPASLPLAHLTADDEVIRIKGRTPGNTNIDVLDSDGNVVATLEVAVCARLKVQAAFHYVKHSGIGTTRKIGEEAAMLRVVNRIYLPQANIEFVSMLARDLPLTDGFGNELNEAGTLANGQNEWEVLTRNRSAGARFNVFFVRELEQGAAEGAGSDTADALATIGGLDCVFEDDAGVDVGESLAHEAGHSLGCRHNTPITSSIDMLMWDTTDQRGRFIPKLHVLLMRSKV